MTRNTRAFAAAVVLAAAAFCTAPAFAHLGSGMHEYAYAVLDQPAEGDVSGNIVLNTFEMDGALVTNVSGVVSGLTPNAPHSVYIYDSADFSNGCASTGGVWNPTSANSSTDKVLGDIGSVQVDPNGVALFNVFVEEDVYLWLFEVGDPPPARSVVVRESQDDTGSAGGRVMCGEIFPFSPLYAMANLTTGPAENISAVVLMTQDEPSALKVQTIASGIPAGGTHGWHIHANPASDPASCDANVTGGYYNPLGLNHSEPTMLVTERHMGDFGNIVGDTEGMVNETITVEHVYLWGAFNVMDRAWVLHAGEDDLGQGGDAGSLATGNAGARIKCGTIVSATAEEVTGMPTAPNGGSGDGNMDLLDDSSAVRLSALFMPIASLLMAAFMALH
eukprot:CAMPEP_0177778014 /NCGR_PEP_ID=MMETSP0491_2-20121128/15711_1 /TAXON_ID=63592 /ORGANISM="Tetraselmis chuii, Strain PLY429" /LENGTH=389 /DNA_ID=CAMNT_0019297225 /DNA_START=125 /DNA_END=1294 /DNA_ORIENTATION=-